MASLSLTLPLTPSLNRYYRSVVIKHSVRVLISREGNKYRSAVEGYLLKTLPRDFETFEGPLAVHITIYMARRGSDGDNRLKGLFDALQHGGVLTNDNQVCTHHIVRLYDSENPRVEITLEEIVDTPENRPLLDAWREQPKEPKTRKVTKKLKTPGVTRTSARKARKSTTSPVSA